MTAALVSAAFVLWCGLALASYLAQMYGGALRMRKRRDRGAHAFFESEIQLRLGYESADGQERYAIVQFVCLALLGMDLLYLSMQDAGLVVASVEAVVLGLAAIVSGALIVPSILALRTRGRWAARLVWLARLLGWLAAPLASAGNLVASVSSVGNENETENQAPKASDEIEALLDAGEKQGLINDEDRKLIDLVVDFGDKTVREVMTPRRDVVAVEAATSLAEVRSLMREKGHSRIPVYEGSLDKVVGFIHSRDKLECSEEQLAATRAGGELRNIELVPETKRVPDLLREMQSNRAQIAIVIDEYGQTAGLVTMEDMMEEIVGEIEDETDRPEEIDRREDGSFVAPGGLDLDRLEELVDYRPDERYESTTVGGLVCERLGHVPDAGAKVRLNGLEVEVLAADGKSVSRVHLRRREPVAEPAQGRGK